MEAVLPPDDPHFFTNLYIVFEVMEADLSRIIRSSQTLTDSHLQYFMIQILSGLAYMHASHVIHRDLKPKNLLINGNCIIKIADFGLAKCFGDDSTGTTAPMTDYVTTRWYIKISHTYCTYTVYMCNTDILIKILKV
jgi:serine/threonine protein kinase